MESEDLNPRDQAVTAGSQVDFSLFMKTSPIMELDPVYVEANNYADAGPTPWSASRHTVATTSQLGVLSSDSQSDHNEVNIINSRLVRKDPPPRQRKRKAPTLRASDWKPHKEKILELHITQKLPLEKVRQIMKDDFGFTAEIRQYRLRITQWKQDKNVKTAEMKAIVKKRQRRKLVEVNKRPLIFEVRGKEVDQQKIERWMKRFNVPDSLLYTPSPDAPTPSDVACYTISERGSPAQVSVASPAASEDSLQSTAMVIQIPQAPSPTPSISSLVRFKASEFPGQSPTISPQALPVSSSQPSNSPGTSPYLKSARRYLQDVEDRLRNRLYKAELSPYYDHAQVLRYLQNLAFVFLNQGRYRKGEDIARRTLEGCRSSFGENSVIMLDAMYLLGSVHRAQGQYSKGVRLLKCVHKRYQTQLEQNHQKMLAYTTELGLVLSFGGKHIMAERLMRSALLKSEELDGPSSTGIMQVTTALGKILITSGNYGLAEDMFRKAWDGWIQLLGPGNSQLTDIASNLGMCLFEQNKLAEGEVMARYAMDASQKSLGPEHPYTLRCFRELALFLMENNRLLEAEELLRSTQSALTKVLGPDHPTTGTVTNSLGHICVKQGEYAEAEATFRGQLDTFTRTLGVDHPATLVTVSYLGRVLLDQGKLANAEQFIMRAFQDTSKTYGFAHLHTLETAKNLVELYQLQQKFRPALDLCQRTYSGYIEVWGAEHRYTKWIFGLYTRCQAEAASLGITVHDPFQWPQQVDTFEI